MLFTFLTITYNHEKFIFQHLESIKYQIINYGEGIKFQLIVADDSSKDNTIRCVKDWLEQNSNLFEYIDILESDKNQGTCKNYTKGIRKIKGDYCKSLAGDDIFAKDNIFEAVNLLKKYDVVCTAVAPFSNSGIYNDKKIYSRIYSMYKFCNMSYEKIARNYISIPMTPGVFMRKELITEDIISFINQFTFIEDRSKNIKIYEQNKKLKISSYDKILVLYRHHEGAVTKTKNNNIVELFNKDSRELYDYVLDNANSMLVKLKIRYKNMIGKIRNRKLATILNIEVFIYRLGLVLNYYKYKEKMNEIIENSFMTNKEYLMKIMEEAKKYDYSSSSQI